MDALVSLIEFLGAMIWLIIIFGIIFSIVIAAQFSNIAREKGHSGGKYFLFTFLFGIAGMLMVVALPDRKDHSCEQAPEEPSISSVIHPRAADKAPENTPQSAEETLDNSDSSEGVEAIIMNESKFCPVCNFSQNIDRKVCWNCGQKFKN